jgi:hypothetical protein
MEARSSSTRRSMSGVAGSDAWIMFSKAPSSWLRTSQSMPRNIIAASATCSSSDHQNACRFRVQISHMVSRSAYP